MFKSFFCDKIKSKKRPKFKSYKIGFKLPKVNLIIYKVLLSKSRKRPNPQSLLNWNVLNMYVFLNFYVVLSSVHVMAKFFLLILLIFFLSFSSPLISPKIQRYPPLFLFLSFSLSLFLSDKLTWLYFLLFSTTSLLSLQLLNPWLYDDRLFSIFVSLYYHYFLVCFFFSWNETVLKRDLVDK